VGVMIWIHNSLRNKLLHYTYWNERILEVRLKLSRENLTILGLYAPEEGCEEDSDVFYKQLQDIYNKVNKNDYVILAGDLNATVGNKSINKNIDTFGEQTVNKNGMRLIDFAVYNNLRIMNTFFNHKNIHKYTWSAQNSKSIIDYGISLQMRKYQNHSLMSELIEDVKLDQTTI
jgi:hypothetical protein